MTQAPTNYAEAMAVLKAAVPTMEDRPQQDLAAGAIEDAITECTTLVCQAGTGVGKSNAALIPAIVSRQRVVYATATKVLQSQIFEKDLPFLQEHLGVDFTFTSLKGWASYLCHARLAEFADAGVRQQLLDELDANPEHVGDRESFKIELVDKDWRDLSISSQDCPGRKQCPFGDVCRPQAARNRAIEADVVVANHSVLATDAVVQDASEGGFSLLGPADVLIVDEAHELEEFISGVLGEQFTKGSITHLVGMFRTFARRVQMDPSRDEQAEKIVSDFLATSDVFFDALKPGRLRHIDVVNNSEPFEQLLGCYAAMREFLLNDDVRGFVNRIADEGEKKRIRANRDRMAKMALNKVEALMGLLLRGDTELIRYVEEEKKFVKGHTVVNKTLKTTPLSVAPWAHENLWSLYPTVVLISATILVDGSADFIGRRLGLEDFDTLDAGTPFDYKSQAVLYVPTNLPEPSGNDRSRWETMAAETMLDLVKASGGGALLLFTSNKQLRQVWDAIAHRLPFECKRQGDETNNRLMTWFRDEHDGVLFATRSFFTGASFEGDTCRLVVIDKLPFPVPTEPVFEARCEEVKQRGGSDFAELTIPMMTLPLQQGFGRLIRTKRDRGVVAILDPRLITKGYGAKIVRSLPPATLAKEFSAVESFFAKEAV